MKRLLALALVLSFARPAWPGELPPPPPPPDEETPEVPLPQEAPQAERVGYYESCFGVPRAPGPPIGVSAEVVVPVSGGASGAPSMPVVSKSSDEKAWLVVAVVAAIALPAVVYVYDKPASPLVLQRFQCPTFSLDVLGGVDNGNGVPGSNGYVSTRLGFGVGHFATDFEYDGAPRSVSAFSTHLLIRPTPREHIEIGLAVGYKRQVLGDQIQEGLEIGLPHRYALWRDGLKTFALEVRPLLLVGSSLEPSLEAAFLVPLAQVLHLRAGGRVYTFAGDLHWNLATGLSLTL
ncbi:MAG TPA: hypothetical protein VE964_11785 [Myxococcales bacterium]|nr:hypothetical protein [Myxococcales bacterium]